MGVEGFLKILDVFMILKIPLPLKIRASGDLGGVSNGDSQSFRIVHAKNDLLSKLLKRRSLSGVVRVAFAFAKMGTPSNSLNSSGWDSAPLTHPINGIRRELERINHF
jgi:hypothetical protein